VAERPRYLEPGWFTRNVFNRVVAGLTKLGLGVAGSRVLRVRGRSSGEWRETPVNPLEFEGLGYGSAVTCGTRLLPNLPGASGAITQGAKVELTGGWSESSYWSSVCVSGSPSAVCDV
jgi:hypothetical protein